MRNRTNMYILNVALADLLTLIVLLIYYVDKRILRYTASLDDHRHVQCALTNLEICLQILTMLFVIALATNFIVLSACISQGIVVVLLWNIAIVASYFNALYCRDDLTLLQGGIYAVLMAILLLVLLGKCCQRCRRKGDSTRDGAFRLNFATIFVCLCLSSWIVNVVAEFALRNETIVKHFVLAFGTSVKVGKNIALALYLFKHNEMFKDSIMALFNCRTVRINRAESINYASEQTSVDISIRNEKMIPA